MGSDIFIKKLLVRKGRLDVQNALNVAQMLFAFAFLIKDHFPKDDVFRRRNVDRPMQGIFCKAVPPSPGKCRIAVAWVEVGLEASRDVDEVEMASAIAGNFGGNHIRWWAVVFGFSKAGEKRRDFSGSDKKWNVDIQREAGFAVVHRSNGTGYEITDACFVKGTRKKCNEVRFGHVRIHGKRFFGIPSRKDWDWSAARRQGGRSEP
jgi:hypothetical protein